MSQTENTETNSDAEVIRKIYAKDVKVGETVHTVFRAIAKERHTGRSGKMWLALSLVDRTGEIEGRVFDNVPAAENAFSNDDYLLVKGKIGTFHNKVQIVIERLERLDPGPIDAAEFAWTPAPREAAPTTERPTAGARDDAQQHRVKLSRRLERLLENPQLAQALDTFVAHLEKALDAQRSGGLPAAKDHAGTGKAHEGRPERPERERRPRGPKVEHKGHHAGNSEGSAAAKPAEPKRDPSLPEGLAFKPFTALVPTETEKPAAPAEAAAAAAPATTTS